MPSVIVLDIDMHVLYGANITLLVSAHSVFFS